MTKIMPIGMQIRKLRELIVNAGFDPQSFDIRAHLDKTLSYKENKEIIMRILKIGRQKSDNQLDHEYCEHLQTSCEVKCDSGACKQYIIQGCQTLLGKVQPCKITIPKTCPTHVKGYCVPATTRACSVKSTNPNRNCPVQVKAYCVPDHVRKCR